MKDIQTMNIYEKLALIGEPVKVLRKSKKGFNYTYVPEEEILAGIQDNMTKFHVSLIPRIVPGTSQWIARDTAKSRVTKDGKIYDDKINESIIVGEITFEWVNNDNPEDKIEVPWFFTGQQSDASQAFGSALTYASRYFKLQFFQIATSNDPDELIAKKKEMEALANKEVVDGIKEQINTMVNDFVKKHPELRDEIGGVIKKYAKDKAGKETMNYNTIVLLEPATRLLDELTTYIKGKEAK